MSELNELIATSSSHAYHAGVIAEQARIIKLLETLAAVLWVDEHPAAGDLAILVEGVIELIKKETEK